MKISLPEIFHNNVQTLCYTRMTVNPQITYILLTNYIHNNLYVVNDMLPFIYQ